MAIVRTDDRNYQNIAAKIREKTGAATTYKPSEMPSGVDEVYEAGKKAEYDAFWDGKLLGGTRTNFAYFIYGERHTAETFKPTHDIRPVGDVTDMFSCALSSVGEYGLLNMKDVEDSCNMVFDFSKATVFIRTFARGFWKHLNIIDLSSAINTQFAFYGGYLGNQKNGIESIERLIISENTVLANSTFQYATQLKHAIFVGIIATNINLSDSPFDKESLTSIINTLSTTTTGLTVTLSLTAVNKAFETSEGANDGSTSAEWLALVATRSNWTIALA